MQSLEQWRVSRGQDWLPGNGRRGARAQAGLKDMPHPHPTLGFSFPIRSEGLGNSALLYVTGHVRIQNSILLKEKQGPREGDNPLQVLKEWRLVLRHPMQEKCCATVGWGASEVTLGCVTLGNY